ncbi:MAG: hypothetical protein EOP50_07235, partial [Sphingobacteriales bacterium]
MGYKASMIIIASPAPDVSDEEVLAALGFADIAFKSETTLEECIYPRDGTLNIGRYNGCLILCDDFRLTVQLERLQDPSAPAAYELALTHLFPDTEILTVACVSTVNAHLYSLVKGGRKLRYKEMNSDGELSEFGDRLGEEAPLYAQSKIIDGQRMFRGFDNTDTSYEYTEDQLMEDFTFGVAKRLLG